MNFHRYSTCVCLFALCTLAQQTPRRTAVRGEVQGALPNDAQVELHPCAGGGPPPASSMVTATGTFELRDLEPGCYRVSVVAAATGRSFYESVHEVNGQGGLQIRLRESKPDRPASTGVALGALRPKPSKKATKLLHAASGLSAQRDYAGAAAKLQEAIAKEPTFAEAHANLGAQLVRLGQPENALAEFEHARLLGLSNAPLHTNVAAALLELKRLPEAEVAVQTALRDDDTYHQAHFIMGQIAVRSGRPAALAATHFRRATPLPGARIMLAQVLDRLGQRREAVAELNAYLDSGHTTYRPVAEKLLKAWR